jgi:hypothetical protein
MMIWNGTNAQMKSAKRSRSPNEAGHDQRHREGIEKDRAKERLASGLLVDQRGEHETERDAGQAADAEGDDVLERNKPRAVLEQTHVLLRANELVVGKPPTGGERKMDRPGNAAEEGEDRQRDRGT